MDAIGLALRVGLSLACVLGLIWLISRGLLTGGARRRGRSVGGVSVLARQSLSRTGSIAVVQVGDRALVLGVTEQNVTLLTETELSALEAEVEELDVEEVENVTTTIAGALDAPVRTTKVPSIDHVPAPRRTRRPAPAATGSLAGSALSPATWSQAVEALRDRTTRR